MKKTLTCPKCILRDLEEKITPHQVKIDSCSNCHGFWFDGGELEKFVLHGDKIKEAIMTQGLIRQRPTVDNCPQCNTPMIIGGLISPLLNVEHCQTCRGFWLDSQELRLLQQNLGLGNPEDLKNI